MRLILFARLTSLITIFLLFSESIFSQEDFYPSDTIWRRTVHRILVLETLKNRSLKHDRGSSDLKNPQSLIEFLLFGVKTSKIIPYGDVEGNIFSNSLTIEEVIENLGGRTYTTTVDDFETDDIKDTTITDVPQLEEIERYEIIEEYYFVKKSSSFKRDIIGIRPIRAYDKEDLTVGYDEESLTGDVDQEDNFAEEDDMKNKAFMKIAWFKFDQLKQLLKQGVIRDPANQNSYYNYLVKFESGDFDSYIISIYNTYGKGIADYTDANENANKPTMQMILESRRIEYELFNFEMNLWEY